MCNTRRMEGKNGNVIGGQEGDAAVATGGIYHFTFKRKIIRKKRVPLTF